MHTSSPAGLRRGAPELIDAGFERIAVVPVGDDTDGLLRFANDQVLPQLQD
ncbi:MAG: hypothetical protein ACK4V6_01015 [Microthrixaceae bacterium]